MKWEGTSPQAPSESLSHWSGEIEDLDTEQLVSALCSPQEGIKREDEHDVDFR